MSKSRQEILSQQGSSEGWAVAIAQAEKGITQAKERIEKLERSIEVFRECRERGEPWPGTTEVAAVKDRKVRRPRKGVKR